MISLIDTRSALDSQVLVATITSLFSFLGIIVVAVMSRATQKQMKTNHGSKNLGDAVDRLRETQLEHGEQLMKVREKQQVTGELAEELGERQKATSAIIVEIQEKQVENSGMLTSLGETFNDHIEGNDKLRVWGYAKMIEEIAANGGPEEDPGI